ncbi:MAG TPA: SBBP repeat-containing protein [Blastocatellia bacterium]|nr:SBBP repeat-containing protein [Blastocatellia bacterium]
MFVVRKTSKRLLALTLALTLNLTALPMPGRTSNKHSLSIAPAASAAASAGSNTVSFARQSLGRLPLGFEINRGQFAAPVSFLARGDGYDLFLTGSEAVFSARGNAGSLADSLRLRLARANAAAQFTGLDELPGRSSYFIGNDPAQWRTNVVSYARVECRDVYPGVNLVYYSREREPEYDFVVAPGADPQAIRLQPDGARSVRIDHNGDLLLRLGSGEIRQHKPLVYQERDGQRQIIPARYVISRRHGRTEIGFAIGAYDPTRTLVIDPVLSYSGYLGGSGIDIAKGVAVDASGNIYVAGFTQSANFPGAVRLPSGSSATNGDAFVIKLNSAGSVIYSVYIGGSSADSANDLAIDVSGNAYLTGQTQSANFPTVNAQQSSFGGGTCNPGSFTCFDAFVVRLNAAGNQLLYSTYLGGSGDDAGLGIAVDGAGSAVVTGQAAAGFPLKNAVRNTFGGGTCGSRDCYDGFAARYDAAGAMTYATYLGGQSDDTGRGVAIDSAGNACVTGYTRSTNFPVVAALQSASGGNNDVFVTKLNASGSQIVYSTYLGGSFDDEGYGIAVDSAGNAYLSGVTSSSGAGGTTPFPVKNPVQATYGGGGRDAFIAKLSASGGALVYSTWYGGSGDDYGARIAVDATGSAFVTGNTFSTNFPLENIVPNAAGSGSDAFVVRLNAAGSARLFSTLLGGNGDDYGNAIAADGAGNVYVAGDTGSTSLPIAAATQSVPGGIVDGFLARLDTSRNVTSFTTVSAASYRGEQLAPESIVAGFGPNLASGLAVASSLPLPTTLGGVSVKVRDTNGNEQSAALFFVSPNQINYQIPAGIAPGRASVTVINSSNAIISAGVINVAAISPGLFTADSSGGGAPAAYAIRVKANNQQSYEAVSSGATPMPIDLGPQGEQIFLVLYGTGLRGRSALNAVTVNFLSGNSIVAATGVEYASVAPGFVGLDQVNLILPRSLAGRGMLDLVVIADGQMTNAVKVNVK